MRVPSVSIVNKGHYCKIAERMAGETKGGFYANQFENTANFRAHYRTTGPEIWQQAGGKIDAFVMAAGTGGTISGVGAFLREQDPDVKVCLIDPPGSALYHKIASGVLYVCSTPLPRYHALLARARYNETTIQRSTACAVNGSACSGNSGAISSSVLWLSPTVAYTCLQ